MHDDDSSLGCWLRLLIFVVLVAASWALVVGISYVMFRFLVWVAT
jgi:hypothetical protein